MDWQQLWEHSLLAQARSEASTEDGNARLTSCRLPSWMTYVLAQIGVASLASALDGINAKQRLALITAVRFYEAHEHARQEFEHARGDGTTFIPESEADLKVAEESRAETEKAAAFPKRPQRRRRHHRLFCQHGTRNREHDEDDRLVERLGGRGSGIRHRVRHTRYQLSRANRTSRASLRRSGAGGSHHAAIPRLGGRRCPKDRHKSIVHGGRSARDAVLTRVSDRSHGELKHDRRPAVAVPARRNRGRG